MTSKELHTTSKEEQHVKRASYLQNLDLFG